MKVKLLSMVNIIGDCWEYTGCVQSNGYSRIRYNGATHHGHRVSYMVFKGHIPDGLCVCHTCDNRKCINPDHLFLGTHKENMEDAVRKGRQAKGEKLSVLRRGEKSYMAKLKEADIVEIRSSDEKTSVLAGKFMVTADNIRRIKNFNTWVHVKENIC